jgi:hypothetical protein
VEEITAITSCLDCGLERDDDIPLCPRCGSKREAKALRVDIRIDKAASRESPNVRMRVKWPGIPGYTQDARRKYRRAGASGNQVRDELHIDRTALEVTVKRHHVEELVDGEWQTVHEEEECYPAKRRRRHITS